MVQAGNEPAVRFWLELHAPVNTRTWYAAHVLADDESGKPNLLPVMKLFFRPVMKMFHLHYRLKLAPAGTATQPLS
jgi:hypothetical protein